MSKNLIFKSPCKANLFFRVLHRRSDGYHSIESLVQTFNWYDTLFFSIAENEDVFSTDCSYLSWDKNNLIFKATELFRSKFNSKFFVKIYLQKSVPSEAGLGGGSSNAATTLFALNELTDRPFSEEELMDMATKLGADVPLFFSSGCALVSGIGDNIRDIDCQLGSFYIVKPINISLSTPSVFQNLDLNAVSCFSPSDLLKSYQNQNPIAVNDLESSAFSLVPRLKIIKQELIKQDMELVVMTGSGSAFLCKSRKESAPFISDCIIKKVDPIYRVQSSWY